MHLFMLDFNPYPIARGAESFFDEHCDHYVVKEETVVNAWGPKPVVSRMPFRVIMSKGGGETDGGVGWGREGLGFADAVVEGECVVGIEMHVDEDDQDLIERIRIMTF